MFVAMDGDNVGAALERAIILEDEQAINEISANVAHAISYLVEYFEMTGGRIIFSGGDNLLVQVNSSNRFDVMELPKICEGVTFSVGIGESMRESYLALKMAKLSGKACVFKYDEINFSVDNGPTKVINKDSHLR